MIDWRLTQKGKPASDEEAQRHACWFPDFALQSLLLPHFNVGKRPIDEYGKTVFDKAAVERLGTHLAAFRAEVEARNTSWSVTERSGEQTREQVAHREAILPIIDKTLAMVDYALSHGYEITFFGD